MSNLQATLEIPKFITKVKTADSRRAKYYRKKKGGDGWEPRSLPKTYRQKLKDGIYSMDGRYLLDEDGNRKLANPQTAGEPRYETLSGNKLLSGYGSPFTRAKLARGLKDFFRPFVQEHVREHGPIEKFPLRVTWDLYTTVEDEPNWDLFNLFFYYKYFEDSLHEETDETDDDPIYYKGEKLQQLIPDDNVQNITWAPGPKLMPVDDWENRKFIFRFYHDKRNRLQRKPWIPSASSNS